MRVPDSSYFDHPIVNPRYLNKNYPELYHHLLENYKWTHSISEALYCWKNHITHIPQCEVCGKNARFNSFKKGYSSYCSVGCSNRSISKKNKVKQTNLERYGVENPSQSQEIISKTRKTNLDKYGVENPASSKEVQEKIKQTNLERYGVEYSCLNKDVQEKIKQTNLERYGVEYGVMTDTAKRNHTSSARIDAINKHSDIVDVDYENNIYTCACPHPGCDQCAQKQYVIKTSAYFDRKRDHTEPCTILLPFDSDRNSGTSLEMFVRSILDKHHVEYISNVRGIISPRELDIYIPSKRIAIECNGVYWHSTDCKPSGYHLQKFVECQKQGIQLITIWEDWIYQKPDIVRSILLSKLGLNQTIYARQCEIKELNNVTSFLDANHIQGHTVSRVKIGLYHNNELVSVMTFGSRQTMDTKKVGEWDLTRFCNKLNINVIGAASRMLKYFISNYHPDTIYSFSSNDISNGHLYETLGFERGCINQSYWYIDTSYHRYHRSTFTKDSIVRRGWRKNKEGWKETDVVKEHGYYQIYDSGQTKWTLRVKK